MHLIRGKGKRIGMTELEPLYDKKYECIFCKKTFSSKKVRSSFAKVSKYDTDFFPFYETEEGNPILYHIHVCPACGFSFSDDFSKYFPPGTKEIITEQVANRWVSHDYSSKRTIQQSIQTYKLGIYCGTLKKEKHIILAGMYMRTAWLYRKIGNKDQEQRFMKLAAGEYEESYFASDNQGTQTSTVRILYLIGELSWRTNNIETAVQYFSKVIESQKQTTESQIVEMAKERWYEIRGQKQESL